MAKLLLVVFIVIYFCTRQAYGQLPTVFPPNDQFIAVNSLESVTYNCTVPDTRFVVWEFRGSQIRSSTQFEGLANLSVIIEPANTMSRISTITITRMARETFNNKDISVQCFSDEAAGINSDGGEIYRVITVFPPPAPGNLMLVPSDPTLTLEWDRPANVSTQVSITYIVDINSTDPNRNMNFRNMTSDTFLSVHFLEELLSPAQGVCTMFDFSVSGVNFAGIGDTAMIIDTVPISPDVTNISRNLTAEVVDLQPLQVRVSFPPVTSCSRNFPLRNYTLSVDEAAVSRTFTPNDVSLTDGLVTVTLSDSNLVEDRSYSLTVTAANDVTRKTSTPRIFYTTDVRRAEAIFFENRLFLRCFFAANSQARGCAIILTLTGSTETERFELGAPGGGDSSSLCTEADNQKEAYSTVEALDIEADSSDGVVRQNITSAVVVLPTEGEYEAMTGCRQPTDNTAAIVGGVIGALLFLLIVGVIVAIAITGVYLGWWAAWLNEDDLERMMPQEKKKDKAAAQPLVDPDNQDHAAAAAPKEKDKEDMSPTAATHQPLVMQTDGTGRQASLTAKKPPKTIEQKVQDNVLLVVKAKRLKKYIEDRAHLLSTEESKH